jgi:predicted choloylglycine hydrolase
MIGPHRAENHGLLSEPLISVIILINMIGPHRVENHVNHKNHIKISGSDNLIGLHRAENHANHKNHIKISGSDNLTGLHRVENHVIHQTGENCEFFLQKTVFRHIVIARSAASNQSRKSWISGLLRRYRSSQ